MLEMQELLVKQMCMQNSTMANVNSRMDEMSEINRKRTDTAMQRAEQAHEMAAKTDMEVQTGLERSAASHRDQAQRFECQLKEGMGRMDLLRQECRQAAIEAVGDLAVRARDRPPAFVAQVPGVRNPYGAHEQDRDARVEFLLVVGGFRLNARRPDIESKLRSIVRDAGVQAMGIFAPCRRGGLA